MKMSMKHFFKLCVPIPLFSERLCLYFSYRYILLELKKVLSKMKFKNVIAYLLAFLIFAAYNVFVIWGLVDWGSSQQFITEKVTAILLSLPVLIFTILVFLFLLILPFIIMSSKKKKKKAEPDMGGKIIGKIIEKVISKGMGGGGFGGGGMPEGMDFDFDKEFSDSSDEETEEKDKE